MPKYLCGNITYSTIYKLRAQGGLAFIGWSTPRRLSIRKTVLIKFTLKRLFRAVRLNLFNK